VLSKYGWLENSPQTRAWMKGQAVRPGLRTVVECRLDEAGAETRYDQPLSFAEGNRRFTSRTVRTSEVPLTDDMISAGEKLCF
jgi:CRISPR system Cascade subunit CasD